MITISTLKSLYPSTSTTVLTNIVAPLQKVCDTYVLSSKLRVAAFLAQTGHESAGFTAYVENLNYSTQGLMGVFGKYFPTVAMATAYARQPQKIASRVYANRMGNGDEASGDGWTYRGKGLIQITGHDLHKAYGDSLKMSLADVTAYMLTTEGAVMSAGWYWNLHNLNTYADHSDIVGMTRVINGGQNGIDDRIAKYRAALALL